MARREPGERQARLPYWPDLRTALYGLPRADPVLGEARRSHRIAEAPLLA
jgi:hypothetical protein